MPPVVAAPTKPGVKGKPLPKWVWLVAIAGGLAVGFLLLKKSPAQGEGEGDEGGGATAAGEGTGGGAPVVVAPLDEALGLKPPSEAGGFNVGYGGGGYSGGDSGGGESSEGTGAQTLSSSLYQYVQQQKADISSTPSYSGQLPTRSVPTTSVASQLRGSGFGSSAPVSGGGGSGFFKAA